MTIGGSLFWITTGAILYFAVTAELAGIDLQVVGVILMVIGAIGLVLGLVLLGSRRRAAAVIDDQYPRRAPRGACFVIGDETLASGTRCCPERRISRRTATPRSPARDLAPPRSA